jgi:branched-chain amino acid aminotransferase
MLWEWGAYLGQEALEEGCDVKISSWSRMAPNTLPAMAKSSANYANSGLIKMEAITDGYSEGIALDVYGNVSEGSGQNIFIVRDGTIHTPPLASVDPRRDHARLGHDARPRPRLHRHETVLPREALYVADEVFVVGTAAEVTPDPVGRQDRHRRRAPGPDHRGAAARVLRRHQRRGAGRARLADVRLSRKKRR